VADLLEQLTRRVLPAQAGVIRPSDPALTYIGGAPRAGGGDPAMVDIMADELECSPRRRG